MISFLMGPMMWITFFVFVLGLVYRITAYIFKGSLIRKNSRVDVPWIKGVRPAAYEKKSAGERLFYFIRSLKSLQPITLVVSIVFHILLFFIPLFLYAHNMLLNMSFGIHLPYIHDTWADVLTGVTLLCCLYFFIRRMADPKVRAITTVRDYILLLIVILPFLSGFLAYHQIFDKRGIMMLHIVTGQIMLMAVPFTRIVHMIVFFINRWSVRAGFLFQPGVINYGKAVKLTEKLK